MSSYLDEHGQPRPERRQKTGLRAVFDDAYRMVEPFFDPATGWGGIPWSTWLFASCARIFRSWPWMRYALSSPPPIASISRGIPAAVAICGARKSSGAGNDDRWPEAGVAC